MATYLDTRSWPRRAAFEYFRGFDKPYFNVCTRLDVARLKAAAAAAGGGLSLAVYFVALRLANRHEPFRLRLEGGRVRVHERVHASTTVLRDDESFGFAELEADDDFGRFSRQAGTAIARARERGAPFEPRLDDSAVIHLTTLPWVHFTSFSHARNWGREDAVPKLAFGRAEADGARLWLPVSVEVHHALMDGLHVGRYLEDFEAVLREPEAWSVGA
jgi:chloramphenicol O-acetyltransferase type A